MPLTDIEREVLGAAWSKSVFTNVAVTLPTAGIHIFMSLYVLSIHIESPRDVRKRRRPYILISFILATLVTLIAALEAYQIYDALATAQKLGVVEFGDLWPGGLRHPGLERWQAVLRGVCLLVGVVVGDALLLYRCYVVYYDRRWLCVFPALTYLASIVFGILTTQSTLRPQSNSPNLINAYRAAWLFTTVGVNVLVTSFVSFRLVRLERRIRAEFSPGGFSIRTSIYSAASNLLIEAAVPAALFGVILAVIYILILVEPHPTARNAHLGTLVVLAASQEAATALYRGFMFLSPQMIVFRVMTGRSWARLEDTLVTVLSATTTGSEVTFNFNARRKASDEVDRFDSREGPAPIERGESDGRSVTDRGNRDV
ncbi:hypothetical protein CC1G_07245 [Coprinopsis cinerea okayama7|uniref:Integral membrane protein n=1 Tax=Coprinopsis cinerea (strain Okayama-7 / 130 / ATCC MYA-4618 / FGSC 9003) TaxID=240176 RepID=A8PD28_COPC7|nr:hypothetical protein CC1G_07245 [Coprinopsis cinerea okayama7\|eukprot:XP_001840515.2 hypothetical protein CC1G_07245 [Coprinopsis cinerea okayama7\